MIVLHLSEHWARSMCARVDTEVSCSQAKAGGVAVYVDMVTASCASSSCSCYSQQLYAAKPCLLVL